MALTNVLSPGIYSIRNVQFVNNCMHESSNFQVQVFPCSAFGSPDQWNVIRPSAGSWAIKPTNNANLSMTSSNSFVTVTPSSFLWKIEISSTSFGLRIIDTANKCVTLPSASTSNAVNVTLADCVGTINQDWIFENPNDPFGKTMKV